MDILAHKYLLVNTVLYFWFKFDLDERNMHPKVLPNQGLNLWLLFHEKKTFRATECRNAMTSQPSRTPNIGLTLCYNPLQLEPYLGCIKFIGFDIHVKVFWKKIVA